MIELLANYHVAMYRVTVKQGTMLIWFVGNAGELGHRIPESSVKEEFSKYARDYLSVHSPSTLFHSVKRESNPEEELYVESSDTSSKVSKRRNCTRRAPKKIREDTDWDGV